MKKVLVIGLGLIGGSICAALTKKGLAVDGFDKEQETVEIALKASIVQNKADDFFDYDTVFIAVPPRAAIEILQKGNFKENALVMDICGVKTAIEEAVYAKTRKYRYVGLHPMAGKEVSGIQAADPALFINANLVICYSAQTAESAWKEAKEYASLLGFGRIVECTAQEHDAKIALTSQLAHLVSNAYVKSEQVPHCEGFTGGSFQDMTRIAGVDEKMWLQLYMHNRTNIVKELDGLIAHLSAYKEAIENEDEQALSDELREGRLIREQIKRGND